MAWSDHDWVLDGANVHVSIVGFDNGSDLHRMLDDKPVPSINSDLTSDMDATTALPLLENRKMWAYGSQQKGEFDVTHEVAQELLSAPNPFGKPSHNVVKRSINGKQLLQHDRVSWVIDFGENMSAAEAALYEAPFEYVREVVYPKREHHREKIQREKWWLHARPSPKYRKILATQDRYLATPVVSKHRVFVWLDRNVLVDHAIVVFAFATTITWEYCSPQPTKFGRDGSQRRFVIPRAAAGIRPRVPSRRSPSRGHRASSLSTTHACRPSRRRQKS
jgi:hypothetical protein